MTRADDLARRPEEEWAPPSLILTGQPEHGVSTYARHLAESVRASYPATELWDTRAAGDGADWVHLHFTDRLWGSDAASAASAVEAVAAHHRVTVTLHDVPQPSDRQHLPRRAEAYRRVVRAASGVVCNSRHEAELLRRFTDEDATPVVIPLPVAAAHPFAVPELLEPAVAILGFYYPGKGHDRAIAAVAALLHEEQLHEEQLREHATTSAPDRALRPKVMALGRASAGHERDLETLTERARRRGVVFEATGYLSDPELLRRSRQVAVPVIAHDHVSASGSLASWITAGRRPIAVRSRYMEEMAALRPGTIELVEGDDLPAAIAHALRHPRTTWLTGHESLHPTHRDTVDLYCTFWAETMHA
ncbi:hypothetical protein ACEXQD_06015 [Herbiconiux sp. P15]|uniref:hypothetical protein n=1 Tax=Herbiconiux liukaitaii TaxID=3342799 RepID=UPI0035B792D9